MQLRCISGRRDSGWWSTRCDTLHSLRDLSTHFHFTAVLPLLSNREDFKCVIETCWYLWRHAQDGRHINQDEHAVHTHTAHTHLCGPSAFFNHCSVTGRAGAADLWRVLHHTATRSNDDGCDHSLDQMGIYKTNEVRRLQICEISVLCFVFHFTGSNESCP